MVSIAGPCRKGKSYILSKVFDQGEVFPLGHELDPETMGIWMWIVPEKFQVYRLFFFINANKINQFIIFHSFTALSVSLIIFTSVNFF